MFSLKEILRMEVAPALGCTEPMAVAFCAAAAGELLQDKELRSIELWLDRNIFKNSMAVTIPGTGGGGASTSPRSWAITAAIPLSGWKSSKAWMRAA